MAGIVTIQYADLVAFNNLQNSNPGDSELIASVAKAFGSGSDCLGILAVEGIPDWREHRQRLLPLAAQLAAATPEALELVTLPETQYSTGWSHGREMLDGSTPDLAKGSYYANPQTNHLVADLCARQPDRANHWKEQGRMHPEFYADNVWPTSSESSDNNDDVVAPGLESAFMELGQLVRSVGILLAGVCDAYCSQKGVKTCLKEILWNSLNTKGRLLHYFDMHNHTGNRDEQEAQSGGNNDDQGEKMWCGWHNDHGSLTGLVPGMFLDSHQGKQVSCPDPSAGLYIQTRDGNIIKAQLPENSCGFQIGEASQIQSGGVLQATPHAVRPPTTTGGMTRESFAVFLEPEFEERLEVPCDRTVHDCQGSPTAVLPSTVLPLSKRWQPNQTFGDFHVATVTAFTV